MAEVPAPVTGSRWIYCRHTWREPDESGRITGYTCLSRFHRLKQFRRHWRKFHG